MNNMRPCLSEEELERIISSTYLVIDGENQVGKSVLADEISNKIFSMNIEINHEKINNFEVIHLDDFLKKQDGGFLERLDLESIHSKFNYGNPKVIEGIMARNVMELLGNYINLIHIYVCTEEWLLKWQEYDNKSLHDIFKKESKSIFSIDSKLKSDFQMDLKPGTIVQMDNLDSITSIEMPMDRFNFDLYGYTAMRQPLKHADYILVKNTDTDENAPYLKLWRR